MLDARQLSDRERFHRSLRKRLRVPWDNARGNFMQRDCHGEAKE
jgi:hypothetical protein